MCLNVCTIRNQILDSNTGETWDSLGWCLCEKAKELQDTDTALADHIRFLSFLFHMELDCADPRQPYMPFLKMGEKRSFLPEDCNEEQLALLDGLLAKSGSSAWESRLADVLWIERFDAKDRRPFEYARMAIEAYLQHAKDKENFDDWLTCGKSLKRALGLARESHQSDLLDEITDYIEDLLDRGRQLNKSEFLSSYLLKLLLTCEVDDPKQYLDLAKKHASQAEHVQDWQQAEVYWSVHKQWAGRLQNVDALRQAKIRIAEGYVQRADSAAREDGGSALAAAHWLGKALEVYRNIPQQKPRYKTLYTRLRKFQQGSLAELQMIEVSTTIPTETANLHRQFLDRVKSEIDDKDLQQSLYILAFRGASYPDYSYLQEQARELMEGSLSATFPTTLIDSQGKVVAHTPSFLDASPGKQEKAEWQKALERARMDHAVIVLSVIEPIRKYVLQQHEIDEEVFLSFCQDNPFVVPGQEELYAQGLYQGLKGNIIIATSLLVPLVENSLRYLLHQTGIETSRWKNGIQEELPISRLLQFSLFTELWGANQVKDLKAILSERSYANLRNRVAHGLMLAKDFKDPVTTYFWWTVLRFVLFDSATRDFNPNDETVASS